jgi:hypothetical protein
VVTLGPAVPDFERSIASANGGFVWWYVDLVDDRGDAAVLLWSFGLPFLPGSRAGDRPLDRPALSLAVYEGRRPRFYALVANDPARCAWDGAGSWTMDASTITARATEGRIELRADLRLPIPGASEATGVLEIEGPLRHGAGEERGSIHSWEPVTLGGTTGSLSLRAGERTWQLSGRAYHDRNGGTVPLHEQGIREWRWGRVSLRGRDLVFYTLTEGDGSVVPRLWEADERGRMREHRVEAFETTAPHWVPFAPAVPTWLEIRSALGTLRVRQSAAVDRGPFYVRSLVEGTIGDEVGRGVAEHVVVDALDRPMHRPFVDMCIQHTRGRNSIWLPLFVGPRHDRLERLLDWNRA